MPKKRLAKWKIWLLVVFGLLSFGGAGAFAYFGYYLPNQPENVIGKAIQNFLLAESFSFSGRADFTQGDISPWLEINGAISTTSSSLSSFWLDTRVNYSSAVIDAKFRGQDQKLYINFSGLVNSGALIGGLLGGGNLDELGVGVGVSQLFSSIENTWFFIDTADLETPVEQSDTISQADRNKVFEILSRYDLFEVVTRDGDQTINGRQAAGYEVKLNAEQFKMAIEEIVSTDYETLEFDKSLADDITSELGEQDTKEAFDYELHVWVYNDDRTLAMVRTEFSDNEGSATLSLAFDDYNQPVNVEVPQSAKPIEELFGSLFSF